MQMSMVMTEVFPSAVQRASWGRFGCVARMTQCEGRKESKGLLFAGMLFAHSAGCANLSYCFGLCSGGLSHPKKSSPATASTSQINFYHLAVMAEISVKQVCFCRWFLEAYVEIAYNIVPFSWA